MSNIFRFSALSAILILLGAGCTQPQKTGAITDYFDKKVACGNRLEEAKKSYAGYAGADSTVTICYSRKHNTCIALVDYNPAPASGQVGGAYIEWDGLTGEHLDNVF